MNSGFRTFVLDQLETLGDVTARSMFGGVGLYRGDRFFGIIAGETVYFKTDEGNRADFESAGMQPFRPYADRPGTMKYHAVPIGVLESATELVAWARKAAAAADRAAAAREPKAGGTRKRATTRKRP